jgi:hypothetical protein
MYLPLDFLVLRTMIMYHIMISLSHLSLLIIVPLQFFINMDIFIVSSLIISMLNGMDTHNIINLTVQAGWEAGLAACPSH